MKKKIILKKRCFEIIFICLLNFIVVICFNLIFGCFDLSAENGASVSAGYSESSGNSEVREYEDKDKSQG
ncbi:MAG: hypothetical protein H7835_18900 [Magnetococcus sp. XQGC-1]